MRLFRTGKLLIALTMATMLVVVMAGSALAAEFASDEVYRLPAGETINDDLYVAASEIYIDGSVAGDLVAAGSIVDVSGTVTGDAIAAAAAINVSGTVEDDARLAGAGVEVSGTIGDDLLASAGGGGPLFLPGLERSATSGLRLAESVLIDGDAVLFGGEGLINGTIAQDLDAFMATITLAAPVGGSADLAGDTITIRESTDVEGTLTYRSDERTTVPEGVAANVVFQETAEAAGFDPVADTLGWLWRTTLILLGFGLLGWLLLRFAPRLLAQPAAAIDQRPLAAGISGFLAGILFIFFPLASALLVFLMVLFGGWFPGMVLGIFLFGALALLWFLSPLVTGVWIGSKFAAGSDSARSRTALIVLGVLLVALLGQIPIVGWFVYLLSFIFAMGGLLLIRQSRTQAPTAG